MNGERRPQDCTHCREQLHAFLDGELGLEAAERLQGHLERCRPCFERSQLEEAFRHAIRAAAAPVAEASAHQQARVKAALDEEDAARSRAAVAARSRGPGPATGGRADWRTWGSRLLVAAAAVLVVAATLSSLNPPRRADESSAPASATTFLRGELVCLDCLMAETEPPDSGLDRLVERAARPSPDPAAHHRLHLRDEEGRYWELFGEEEAAALLEHHDNAGRAATVVGSAWPRLGVVTVARLDLD